ncbi:urease accessory protein UreE [Brunnivagina elsteri]|uniref:Urease accessory protein UreE n=1 Tax=Brunnivagina elsteri CCALA 953 TaxID=987040 RepID=A0A2A2TP87_9CYAN|nr:urease accessory protein UreE [Calothrix elsteri]PAX60331.1 urease accessory protein UreE [Calothrix elsteri CCALA 953]
MFTVTQRQSSNPNISVNLTLPLTAEERTRSRHRFELDDGKVIFLRLPRGTVLQDGDILLDETGDNLIRIVAKSEAVLTAIANSQSDLLRAAYHLGNRHVPVEITSRYLRISPDNVLQAMLEQLGLFVKAEILPFYPERGAYGHQHHPN